MKLLNSLYGLPDYPMNWWNNIDPYLVEIRFEPHKFDTCVYISTANKGVITVLTLHVHDMLLFGGDNVMLEMINKKLVSSVKMTDMEYVSLILGMQATHTRPREGHHNHQPRRLHRAHAREVRHERVQVSEHARLGIRDIAGAGRGESSG